MLVQDLQGHIHPVSSHVAGLSSIQRLDDVPSPKGVRPDQTGALARSVVGRDFALVYVSSEGAFSSVVAGPSEGVDVALDGRGRAPLPVGRH